ncbi:MAG: methionyl-tRNA formyltransferase [Bacteroidales bacterium]|nr:methionyl-tRNA formyltransferase [Bacteroidales bacterium]
MKNLFRKIKRKVVSIFHKTRIVYMGTPEFAIAPLEELLKNGYKVIAVVTVPDKASGRGLKVNESAVKKYAVEHNIPVYQPEKMKDPEFIEAMKALKPDLFVVVAFRMLPKVVWEIPKLGTFNLHAALLPQYRGAAPINWAIINGERVSGVTTFMIDDGIDTGKIMIREQVRIDENETAGSLHDKLMEVGSKVVLQTVEGLIENDIEFRLQKTFIQGDEQLRPAPKLTKELCHIKWDADTVSIRNLIRGLSPYPAAYTDMVKDGVTTSMKIFSTTVASEEFLAARMAEKGVDNFVPGTVLSDGKTYLAITTNDGALLIDELQLAGKKRMDVKAFLLGFRDPESYSIA